ncbi:MAG: ATP synthase subunit I [Syntrophaceae bacterium]|nr:ATP synthase subunit I [Syntrophaceae bacterium]
MNSLSTLIVPFLAGCLLGFFYFTGLWQTVKRLPGARHPWRLLVVSYAARLASTLGGFYLLMDGSWERPVAAVIGFLTLRTVMVRGLGPKIPPPPKGVPAWKS